jgi:hypothetical protein
MLRLAQLAAVGVVLIGTPMQAAEQTSTHRNDPNEIICKLVPPEIGSRLGGGRQCATRRAWDERRKRDRELTEDAQGRISRGASWWW